MKGNMVINRFEKALKRIEKNVEISPDWNEEDMEHHKTIIEALKIASRKEDEGK